jgi:hypothetical protein
VARKKELIDKAANKFNAYLSTLELHEDQEQHLRNLVCEVVSAIADEMEVELHLARGKKMVDEMLKEEE